MWNPKYLTLKNIFSHEDTTLNFTSNVENVTGVNLTNIGQKSNGSGKSGLVDGMSLSLLDTTTRYNSNKKAIRRGCSSGEIISFWENKFLGKTLLIHRTYHKSKSAKVFIEEDGILREDLKDLKPSETNKEIIRILGVSAEDISNYFILTGGTHTPFFSATDGTKKKTINRFSNIDSIDPIIEEVKSDVKKLEDEKSNYETENIVNDTKMSSKLEDIAKLELLRDGMSDKKKKDLEAIDKEIESQKLSILSENDKIDEWKSKMETLSKIDIEKGIKSLEDEKSVLEKDLIAGEVDKDSMSRKKDGISEKIESIENLIHLKKRNLRTLKSDKSQLELIKKGSIDCPKCRYEFNPSSDKPIDTVDKDLIIAEKSISDINIEIASLDKDLRKLEDSSDVISTEIKKREVDIKNINNDITKIRYEINEAKEVNDKINSIKKNIERIKETLHHYKESIVILQKRKDSYKMGDIYTSQINDVKSEIDRLEENKENILEDIESVDKEVVDTSEWVGLFKSFKSTLANQAISSIEDSTNHMLEKLNTDISVNIEGYRLLSNGKDLKEEISVSIDRPMDSGIGFEELSGGEKARVNVANILSIQDMINSSSLTGGLDLLIIDEVLESLDEFGLSSVLNALHTLKRTILVISHIKTQSYANEVVVVKENNISTIKS